MQTKIATIVGARPQFIKLAPFSREIRKHFNEVIIHTGQHYDSNMSGNFFADLAIPKPDYDLGIGSGNHGRQTGEMLIALEEVILREKPGMVVVFGDTNSTLAGALVAAKLHIPVAHVEAGLRSFNKTMPEEINRILTDHCSDLLFAPTRTAMENLQTEGLLPYAHLTGDIMLDALETNKQKAREKSGILTQLNVQPKDYLLMTLHRPYNVDQHQQLKGIFHSLKKVNRQIVFPVHPRTRKMLQQFGIEISQNVKMIDPVGYLDFIMLEQGALKILTDSGGIQKEAYLLGIPCITLRPETEWIETVQGGWNQLIGFNTEKLIEAIETFQPATKRESVFGEYPVAPGMVNVIRTFLS